MLISDYLIHEIGKGLIYMGLHVHKNKLLCYTGNI